MDMSTESCSRVLVELHAIKLTVYTILGMVTVTALGTALRTYRYVRQLALEKLEDEFRSEAKALLEKNKLDELIALTKEKSTECPNHTSAHWYLARAYYLQAEWQRAKEEFETVGRLEPNWQEEYVIP